MSDYTDPGTGERMAVLRPDDPKLALRRLAEWNAVLDEAEVPEANLHEIRRRGEAKWLELLKEQGWRFVGWLQEDTKQTSGGPAAPGDLHYGEKAYLERFRP